MAVAAPVVDCETRSAFARDGFLIFDQLVPRQTCADLCLRLECVLQGDCDGPYGRPDKAPKLRSPRRTKPGKQPAPLGGPSKQTLQVINIWKADAAFASVVLSPCIGRLVAMIGGWAAGARIANDQVWAKPPRAGPLTFHRDSAYFDFLPSDVITVWIALDDMEPELGPLQYVHGSHAWADGRVGSANQFFDSRNRFALLHDAAKREGIADPSSQLQITTLTVKAGGCGIHDGRLWHGSGPNLSEIKPRRGLGIHFIPADAKLREASGSTLAHTLRFVEDGMQPSVGLCGIQFPITWSPTPHHPLATYAQDTLLPGHEASHASSAERLRVAVKLKAILDDVSQQPYIEFDLNVVAT